jgi:hypothetical protein
MAWGHRVRNSATNTIQIGEDYRNLSLISKGTATQSGSLIELTFTGRTAPLLALRAEGWDNACAVFRTTQSGDTFTYYIFAKGTVTWYLFDVPPSTGLGFWGRIVRNAMNQIVFRSDLRYLIFRGQHSALPVMGGPVSTTLPTGRVYAVISYGGAGGFAFPVPGTETPKVAYNWVMSIHHFDSNIMRSNSMITGTYGPVDEGMYVPPDYDIAAMCYAVDVTNM